MNQKQKTKMVEQFRRACEERMSTKDYNYIDNRIDDLVEALDGLSQRELQKRLAQSETQLKAATAQLEVVRQILTADEDWSADTLDAVAVAVGWESK